MSIPVALQDNADSTISWKGEAIVEFTGDYIDQVQKKVERWNEIGSWHVCRGLNNKKETCVNGN